MSDTSSTHERRGLVVDLFIFGFGGTIFLLAGLFSNFYTSSTIEILLIAQGSVMVAYGVVVYEKVRKEEVKKEKSEDWTYQSFRLGFLYTVGVALMLLNARFDLPISSYHLTLYTAPIGYFMCIAMYLAFAAFVVKIRYSLKANRSKTLGILILVGVVAITLALLAYGVFDFTISFSNLWLWIAAALVGLALNLLTKDTRQTRPQVSPATSQPPQSAAEVEIQSAEQVEYRARVREALRSIRPKLEILEPPQVIEFATWNTEEALRKQQLMGRYHQLVEKFSSALNKRNDEARRGPHVSLKFADYSRECINVYQEIEDASFLT